jgi:phosphonate transport system ATP-binding protein
MIDLRDVSKAAPDGRLILDRISFRVRPGEFVGILGPSGAGKTLTMRCLNGLTRPDTGTVTFSPPGAAPVEVGRARGRVLRQVRRQIGVVFQGFHLVKRLSAIDNVLIGRLGSISPWRSLVYGFTDAEADAAMTLLEQLQIGPLAYRPVGSLSGGEMQRVAVARALLQNPVLLLADEPVASLDPANARNIMQVLRPLADRMPVVGVFHQPELVREFCTRVVAIKAGRVVHDGSPDLSRTDLLDLYGTELTAIDTTRQVADLFQQAHDATINSRPDDLRPLSA